MLLDPRQSLQLAFAHLDAFSVPGVGTFRRTRYSAVIDHQSGIIQPPGERFILERGETLVERLTEFYFRFLDLSISKAHEMVDAVAAFVLAEVRRGEGLPLPGIGKLQAGRQTAMGVSTSQPELVLVPESGSTQASGPFFGLSAIPYNLNMSKEIGQTEKVDAARRHTALRNAPVEPSRKPTKKRRKRSMQPFVIVFLLLVMLVSGAGIIWQDKFQAWLKQAGLLANDTLPGDTLVAPDPRTALLPVPKDTLPDMTPVAEVEQPKKAKSSLPKKEVEPVLVDATRPAEPQKVAPVKVLPKAPVAKEPTSTPQDLSAFEGRGEYAQTGMYYLVVGARKDASEALRIAEQVSGNGVKAKVLVPKVEGPHYKIAVFQDPNKQKVINQMITWKDRFPEKSWIFWIGM